MEYEKLLEKIETEGREYRKKPVVIKAIQLTETTSIQTREGTLKGYKGDYLIRGVEREIYPCGNDIFHKTYEECGEK